MKVFHTGSRFGGLLRKHHFAVSGQTGEIAPADRKLYALRDATGTVESIPLIVASIMSKKLALKSDGIVFDVKSGDGAFMKEQRDAVKLLEVLLEVSKRSRLPAKAIISDMNQPTGRMTGNFLEVIEAVEVLKGGGPEDTKAMTLELSAQMLNVARMKLSDAEAKKMLHGALQSGDAYERFAAYVKDCGGDIRVLEEPSRLVRRAHKSVVTSAHSGYITGFATARLGYLGIMLGAGRQLVSDRIDPVAGFEFHVKIGESVDKGSPLVTVYGSDRKRVRAVSREIEECIVTSTAKPKQRNLILKRL
jgi:pyrimidine-nucleoside phosphorylase